MTEDELIIACLLDPDLVRERVDDWKRLVAEAQAIEGSPDGAKLRFGPGTPVEGIAALAEAERECCPFFTFVITIGEDVTLDVTAPLDARPLVDLLFGLDEGRATSERS